jgi:hypothetical protein
MSKHRSAISHGVGSSIDRFRSVRPLSTIDSHVRFALAATIFSRFSSLIKQPQETSVAPLRRFTLSVGFW